MFRFGPDTSKASLGIPDKPVKIRDLISLIEGNTGMKCRILWDGTGASILRGAIPFPFSPILLDQRCRRSEIAQLGIARDA